MPDSSTILLVDDEDSVQKLLAYPLERDGFRVLQARDGEEALAQFADEHVDLVEFELLRTLASHPGRVYSRRMLLEALWGGADYREPRTIDVHVRHLREKLEPDPAEPEYILTVRGVGYRFRDR